MIPDLFINSFTFSCYNYAKHLISTFHGTHYIKYIIWSNMKSSATLCQIWLARNIKCISWIFAQNGKHIINYSANNKINDVI